jgi:hypothetical protein
MRKDTTTINAVRASSLNLPEDCETRNINDAIIGMPNSADMSFDFIGLIIYRVSNIKNGRVPF